MADKRRVHRKAFVINRIPLSCEHSDVSTSREIRGDKLTVSLLLGKESASM